MAYRILFILSILASASVLKGQQVQVRNQSDHTPIESVAVFNISRDKAAITDSLGMIDVSIFQSNDTIIFQHPAYMSKEFCRSDLSDQKEVFLQRKRILIDEYVISASKYRESSMIIPYMVDVLEDNVLMESTGFSAADICNHNRWDKPEPILGSSGKTRNQANSSHGLCTKRRWASMSFMRACSKKRKPPRT